jgi:hypothetical protein
MLEKPPIWKVPVGFVTSVYVDDARVFGLLGGRPCARNNSEAMRAAIPRARSLEELALGDPISRRITCRASVLPRISMRPADRLPACADDDARLLDVVRLNLRRRVHVGEAPVAVHRLMADVLHELRAVDVLPGRLIISRRLPATEG